VYAEIWLLVLIY